jgi:transposase
VNQPGLPAHLRSWDKGGWHDATQYDEQTRERAVRLITEHAWDCASEWGAIKTISDRLGMSTEVPRKWVRQAEVDAGGREGVTSEAARQIRELKRPNAVLERTVEILKAATSFFVRESDPLQR